MSVLRLGNCTIYIQTLLCQEKELCKSMNLLKRATQGNQEYFYYLQESACMFFCSPFLLFWYPDVDLNQSIRAAG